METKFGFRDVNAGEKQGLVNEVFAKSAARYDQMNDLMSGGLHRLWKDDFLTQLNPPRNDRAFKVLDVAGGTGDIAFRIAEVGGDGTHVTIADISPDMVGEGRRRAEATAHTGKVDFTVGNAESLAFPDQSFDAYTIAFGIRNVTHIDRALAEALRVLRPGGRFFCLEFSTVEWSGLKEAYDIYSEHLLPRMGQMIAGDAESYRYLAESIRKFPPMPAFEQMIRSAGFANTKVEPIMGGLVAIHSGWKI